MTSVSSSASSNGIASLLQRQEAYGQRQSTGLTDRNTVSERKAAISQVQQAVSEKHGFEARQYTKDALANNTKIVNTRADQRGTVVNITV